MGLCPEVREGIHMESDESGGNPLGSTCFNLYTCNDYMAPQHFDHDQGWSICTQLQKVDCQEDEYNFSFTEWGVYIVTQEKTIWWVSSASIFSFCLTESLGALTVHMCMGPSCLVPPLSRQQDYVEVHPAKGITRHTPREPTRERGGEESPRSIRPGRMHFGRQSLMKNYECIWSSQIQ